MSRSLKVSPKFIQKVKSALKRNSYPSQKAFAQDVGLSLATVKNCLSGKPVDYLNFVEFCQKLELDWQEIAYLEYVELINNPLSTKDSPTSCSEIPAAFNREIDSRLEETVKLYLAQCFRND